VTWTACIKHKTPFQLPQPRNDVAIPTLMVFRASKISRCYGSVFSNAAY